MSNFCFYFYKVKVWNSDNKAEEICRGITIGESLSEAVENLTKMYGEEEIIDIKSLTAITNLHCLEIEDKIVADYLRKIEDF